MAYSKGRPHNPDPEKYQIIKTREGWYLKRRRGTVKPATINETLRLHAASNCGAETKEVFRALKPFIPRLYGRLQVYFAMRLKKAKLETGRADYRYCEGYEINRLHPLQDIYLENISITEKKGMLYFDLPVSGDGIRKKNNLVTDFYFEAILINGDPAVPGSLRSESDRSELISYNNIPNKKVQLNLILPAKDIPYLVILKFGCMEGRQHAAHGKHYGVKVVKVNA